MTRKIALCGALLLSLGVAPHAAAQQCTSFPWVVSGSDIPGGVVVNVCGLWVGCYPHDQRVTVSSNQIAITYTAAELPGCICTQSQIPFNQNVFVSSLPQGTYGVTVTVMDCGQPNVVGTGNVVSGALAAIPVLDRAGLAALVLLLAAAAVWTLRA